MEFGLDAHQREFLDEVRAFLDAEFPEDDGVPFTQRLPGATRSGSYFSHELAQVLADEHRYWDKLASASLRGIDWPVEHGGAGRSAVEQWVFLEEMAYRRLPAGGVTLWSIGRTLIRLGTEAQRRGYLPGILSGAVEFALGYTEPDAGSDLASLRTRAVRCGDRYVVDGQKVFTTAADHASHLWLAARTGPPGSRHGGISVFVVPLDAPGITIRPMVAQSGEVTNEVFLDGVEVPPENLVGEENGGWEVITTAINFERLHTYSGLARDLEELVAWVQAAGPDDDRLLDDVGVRRQLAVLAADLEMGRLLAAQTAARLDGGTVPAAEAAMVKVWLSELRERLASTALDLMGPPGQQRAGTEGAPLDGMFEESYRYFPVRKFAAGTNDVLRSVIARRELGLPRE